MKIDKLIIDSLIKSEKYVKECNFSGFDPYDALNSNKLIKINNKLLKIFFTQFFVYSPLNLRDFFDIYPDINPKAMGLFLSAYCRLYKCNIIGKDDFEKSTTKIVDYLLENKSKGYSSYCWGFNFNWQDMSRFTDKWLPTIVVTSYIGNSILDLYEIKKEKKYLIIADSICSFILNDLNISETKNGICFSYTPIDEHIVHNANCLGAAFLSRVYSINGDNKLFDFASRAIDYSISCQNDNGSWHYGINPTTNQKRNQLDFHQGFILDSIIDFIKYSGKKDIKYNNSLLKGFQFYKNHQFEKKGRSLWRLPWRYPVDIHNQSQGIISFSKMYIDFNHEEYLDFAKKIAFWTIKNMQDKTGFFYYHKWPLITNKISYIRWSQAWMINALSLLLLALKN